MKLSIYFAFILILSRNSLIKAQNLYSCDHGTYRRIDELTAKLITFGNSGRKFPQSKRDVPKYCK